MCMSISRVFNAKPNAQANKPNKIPLIEQTARLTEQGWSFQIKQDFQLLLNNYFILL